MLFLRHNRAKSLKRIFTVPVANTGNSETSLSINRYHLSCTHCSSPQSRMTNAFGNGLLLLCKLVKTKSEMCVQLVLPRMHKKCIDAFLHLLGVYGRNLSLSNGGVWQEPFAN